MQFEPLPQPQDLGIIQEEETVSARHYNFSKKSKSKRHFDIYKDMNVPKV
jgi:hypothetical protein